MIWLRGTARGSAACTSAALRLLRWQLLFVTAFWLLANFALHDNSHSIAWFCALGRCSGRSVLFNTGFRTHVPSTWSLSVVADGITGPGSAMMDFAGVSVSIAVCRSSWCFCLPSHRSCACIYFFGICFCLWRCVWVRTAICHGLEMMRY